MSNMMPGSIKDGERHRTDYIIGGNQKRPRWPIQPWQRSEPWAYPFGGPQGNFNLNYGHLGPWQNPTRHFGPMRPDFQFHGGCNLNLGPRMGPVMMGHMDPNGPIMPNMIPNGPLGPMGMGNAPLPMCGMGPGSRMMNDFLENRNIVPVNPPTQNSLPSSTPKYEQDENVDDFNGTSMKNASFNRELPIPGQKLLDKISLDVMRSISINGTLWEIRYYEQTAVTFLNWDDPKEIGFQEDGVRRVLIDGKETITCAFNESFKEFLYMGEVHTVKLGGPTRELYIDDRWYKCFFGGPAISVDLGGRKFSVKLEGPSPPLKIGIVKRTDLVVAKINLIINAKNIMPVFLDAKPQIFEIEGQPHTLEFIDALQTVLLNGRPFKVEFGGLPMPIIVKGRKHFIQFSDLPKGVRAGHIRITGMRGKEPIDSPPITPRLNQNFSVKNSSSGLSTYKAQPGENLPVSAPVVNLNLNIDELFKRLAANGIVNLTEPIKQEEPEIFPVSFTDDKSLKVKQPALVSLLYCGKQCNSCGLRFPTPEVTPSYRRHLDWHFRQNRKEKGSIRKVHSQAFFYDSSDWIHSDDVEELEDRVQSWFETEKQTNDVQSAVSEDVPNETEQPSVPSGSATVLQCHVCHDEFVQFFNEEMEEWQIKPAVVFEDNYFHPLCLEDHKRASEKSAVALEVVEAMEEEKGLSVEAMDSTVEAEVEEAEEEKVDKIEKIDEIGTVLEGEESVVETDPEIVITDPPAAPIIKTIDLEAEENEANEIIESEQPAIEQEERADKVERVDQPLEKIKIKEKPLDESEVPEEFVFTNVEIKEEPIETEPEPELEESIEPTEVDTTHAAMKSSIDGNVELESAPATMPAASSKIKINITKLLTATREPEEQKESPVIESLEVENSHPLSPATVKTVLKSRNLKVCPQVEKGEEMSGLCSIM